VYVSITVLKASTRAGVLALYWFSVIWKNRLIELAT
jgi:hypothetical protein